MDIRKYLQVGESDKLDGRAMNASIPGCSLSSQINAARELNILQEKEQQKKKRQVLPETIKKSVAYEAWKNGIPVAQRWA